RAVDTALGRATRQLFAAKATRALFVAVDLRRDRALLAASARLSGAGRMNGTAGSADEPEPLAIGAESTDAAFAVGAGALVASHWIAQTGGGFGEAERRAMLQVLAPAAQSAAARDVKALLG
ncbi:MAG: hypothetical protein KIS78_23710, partial [Labilithrix sp.]|nr:hypothetical protein [Labilithrix sp.]